MSMTVLISGVAYAVHVNSIQTSRRLGQAATCSFQIEESVASQVGQKQGVVITETSRGVVFSGFIESIQLIPHSTNARSHNVTCIDKTYLAQKWVYTRPDFVNRMAGDVVSELHQTYLAQEGISANYAMRHDSDAVTFGQGTLTNVNASGDGLALTASGTTTTITEDLSTGTRTNIALDYSGPTPALTLASQKAIKFTASATSAQRDTNLWCYRKIWGGAVTVAEGDIFMYDMFVASTSPANASGMELDFSNGAYLRDFMYGYRDQNGYLEHPNTNTSAYSSDAWYHREIVLVSNTLLGQTQNPVGKSIAIVSAVLEGDTTGDYTTYFRNAYLLSANRVVKATFFAGTLNSNLARSLSGYYNPRITVVDAYEAVGTRVSPAYSLGATGIARTSIASWIETAAIMPTGAKTATLPQITLEASLDNGATWDTLTNHMSFPSLLAGMRLSGVSVILRQTLALRGPDPCVTPRLAAVSVSVSPACAASKNDVWDTDADAATFAGTLSNMMYANGGLQLWTQIRNYDVTPDLTQQPTWGINASQRMDTGALLLNTDPNTGATLYLDWAGTWNDCIFECDILCPLQTEGNVGITYCTTSPRTNTNNCYAYAASLSYNLAGIYRGSNGTVGAFTVLQETVYELTPGTWYHMKLVKSGASHTLYINDILLCQATDSTFSGNTGAIALRQYHTDATAKTSRFNHIGISPALTGVYTSNSVSLGGVGTVESSRIMWKETANANVTILVETQVDSATWQACTNGGTVPNLPYGASVTSASVRHRVTYTTFSVAVTPRISGLSIVVLGKYTATGTRVSPVLSINAVGRIGSSSLTWIESTPPSTTTYIDTSPNGSTWTQAVNGQTVAGVVSSPAPTTDDYTVNNAGAYTSTFMTGGAASGQVFDTAHSELVLTGGSKALYVWNSLSMIDGVLDCICRQSEDSGILARYTNALNFYSVLVHDAASGTNANTIVLMKTVNGTVTQLGAAPIAFTRLTNHTVRLSILNAAFVVSFDGVTLLTVTDSSLGASGKTGFYSNGHTALIEMLRIQPQEDDATGRTLYTRVRFTSTNTQLSPSVHDMVLSVRGLTLASGALLPLTQYRYQKKVGDCIQDAAKKSNCWASIDDNGVLTMLDKHTRLAPFPLSTANGDILRAPLPNVTQSSPKYRNRQYIDGASDLVTTTELCPGNGFSQSWPLKYPIQTVTSITINGQSQTIGIAGVDTSKNFYYTAANHVLSQDLAAIPLDASQFASVTYQGIVPYVAVNDNLVEQAALRAIDGSTGIVEETESLVGGTRAQADQLAAARNAQYTMRTKTIACSTLREGLALGHFVYIFAPELGVPDNGFLITALVQTYVQKVDQTFLVQSDVTCVDGEIYSNWTDIFVNDI